MKDNKELYIIICLIAIVMCIVNIKLNIDNEKLKEENNKIKGQAWNFYYELDEMKQRGKIK